MARHAEISADHRPVLLSGTCQQLLLSPRGSVEGALLKVQGAIVQLVVDPAGGTALLHRHGPGKRLRVRAVADRSPKARDAAHPVFRFESFADAAGLPVATADPSHTTIKGTVATLHYARHGEANGVVLDSGEFIHLKPHGMALTGLEVGSRVTAIGAVRDTVLGTPMLEARQVNRIDLS